LHRENAQQWEHSHTFGQERKRAGESRTLIVIAITGIMMIVEITAGVLFGSMALLADGMHMASHAVALGISAFAYIYARRNASNAEYSFGTGKVNALGGYTGAILLAMFAVMMAWESCVRIIHPTRIVFNQAILVAVMGLIVNGVSVFILGVNDHGSHAGHESHHNHDHDHDHNLRSAYLHVLADALTSVLAIGALLVAKYFGYLWMDPLMGIVGAVLVARWSLGLLLSTSKILLDRQGPRRMREQIKECIEGDNDSILTDLHLWSIGPQIYSAILTIVAHHPQTIEQYRRSLPHELKHVAIEIHTCPDN